MGNAGLKLCFGVGRVFRGVSIAFIVIAATPLMAEPKILAPNGFKEKLDEMEAYATHLESYSPDGLSKLATEASELIYSAGHMDPPPKDDTAAMWCTMATQALRNHIDYVRKGVGLGSAQMKDYREFRPKCLKALKKG